MWTMSNLTSYISKINLSATQHISNIESYTADISVIDASHMKYGDIIPVVPKISYETINLEDHGITITSSFNRTHITSDEEILILAGDKYYKYDIASGEFTDGSIAVTLRRHHINHFVLGGDGYYYGLTDSFSMPVTHLATVCKYEDDFSTTTSYEVEDLYDEVRPDGSKFVLTPTNIYKYMNGVRSSFLLDGTFVEDTVWTPEDRMYFESFDIGLESWNHRYIKTLRHDSNVYFLDQLLIPRVDKNSMQYSYWQASQEQYNVSVKEIDGSIVFARLINKQYLHLTRMELV